MTKIFITGVLAGAIGGTIGAYALNHLSTAAAVTAHSADVIAASRIRLVDGEGKTRAEMAISADGGPALFFYDSAGRNRMVLGLYSAAEREAPSVVLNDPEQHAAGIFRLFGAHDTPVVVLKNKGRDRSIYGLNAATTEPFLTNYAGGGSRSDVFGSF
jgi:hypothetical protein